MTTRELTNYKPYSIGRYHDNYADIIFEKEGVMTVPKNSAQAMVDFMNTAFKNGVMMGLKQNQIVSGSVTMDTTQAQNIIKPKPMPEEEPHPLNNYKKTK